MVQKPSFMGRKKFVVFFILLLIVSVATNSHAQSGLKRVQMGSSSTNVSFLALYTALNRGFFKEEGIDLEIVFMPANLASTAVLNGDLDYNGAVTGTIGSRPAVKRRSRAPDGPDAPDAPHDAMRRLHPMNAMRPRGGVVRRDMMAARTEADAERPGRPGGKRPN